MVGKRVCLRFQPLQGGLNKLIIATTVLGFRLSDAWVDFNFCQHITPGLRRQGKSREQGYPLHTTASVMFSTIDAVELTPSPSSSFDSYRSPLSSRHGHATVALPSAVVVLGGLQGEKYLNDVYILRDGDAEWSQVELAGLMMWSPRSGFGCCAAEGVIYVSGGCNDDCCFNDLWKSEDEGANWTRIQENIDHFAAVGPKESYPARANFYMTYKPTSNSLVLLGGTDFSEAFNDVYEFDLNRRAPRRWSKVREGRKRIGGVMGLGSKYDW